jgi:ABC-type sugar transport system permease subunit
MRTYESLEVSLKNNEQKIADKRQMSEGKFAFLLLLPSLILIAILIIYPLIYSFVLSLSNFDIQEMTRTYVGFSNYLAIFEDQRFAISLKNTIIYLLLNLILGIVISLILALVLDEPIRGKALYKTSLLVPWAISPIVISVMFLWIFHANYGIVNYALLSLGLVKEPIQFLGDPAYALYTITFVNLWKFIPLVTLILLTGLQNLNRDQIKAAKIDGANAIQRFIYIILPHLRPTILAASIVLIVFSLLTFDLVYAMTGGGPADSTFMLYFLAYKTSFDWLRLGYGASIAYWVTFIVVILAILMHRFFRERKAV